MELPGRVSSKSTPMSPGQRPRPRPPPPSAAPYSAHITYTSHLTTQKQNIKITRMQARRFSPNCLHYINLRYNYVLHRDAFCHSFLL